MPAEGLEQPVSEPQVQETPAAEAPQPAAEAAPEATPAPEEKKDEGADS